MSEILKYLFYAFLSFVVIEALFLAVKYGGKSAEDKPNEKTAELCKLSVAELDNGKKFNE